MSIDEIRNILTTLVDEYSITKISLFGSRAEGSNREDSDVDLIMEFDRPVTIMLLAELRDRMEELIGLKVDVVHGPVKDTDMIEVGKVVELYAA